MCENTPNPNNEEILEQTTEWSNPDEQVTETEAVEVSETNDVPAVNPEPTVPADDIEIDETVAIDSAPENE